MKSIYKISLMALMLFVAVSCEKSLSEVNIDPNNSPTAGDAQVLTSAQGFLGYIVDVDLNSRSFLWAQYYTWGIGVSIGNQERFVAQPDDYDTQWERTYSRALIDLKYLLNSESAAYRGIAKALQVYMYQGLVDHFGDIPYSNALLGEIADGSVLTPTYDEASAVYTDLIVKIDEAIADLAVASSDDVGAEDLVYGGDISKWQKFANSLKLRILMRLSEVGGQASAVQSVINAGNFISSGSDVAEIAFAGTTGDQNPMYARFEWGVGDFYFASNTTLNVLNDLDDPRIGAFYSVATTGTFENQFHGIDQGTIDDEPFTAPSSDYSGSSPQAYGNANSVVLMSDWEVWFLRAEAAARYGTSDNDATAFANAITANFSYLGVDGAADYITSLNYGDNTTLDAKLDEIAVQKWISLNGTQEDEGWIEARRFDRPASRLFTNGIWQTPPLSVLGDGVFPSAWLYPASERSLNPNAPAQRTLTDKIFWDN